MKPQWIKEASLLIVATMLDGATLEESIALASRMVGAARGDHAWPTLITVRGRSLQPFTVTGRTMQAACRFEAALSAVSHEDAHHHRD